MGFKLKGGVLIVGSLFWQNDRNPNEHDDIRRTWRQRHLDLSQTISVSVPIRYGRFSRDRIYTMIFDAGLPKENFGKGKAVPFKKYPANWSELKSEVEELSNAEGRGNGFIKFTSDEVWCLCAILFNPRVDQVSREEILFNWESALLENEDQYKQFVSDSAAYSVSRQGELEISWPTGLENFDYLIATSTKPKIREGTGTSINEIATHIGNRNYFIPNFLSGIGTYQDRGILKWVHTDKEITQKLFISVIENYETIKNKDKNHRYWSWDQCRTCFNSDADNDTKALHLASYLASWGMYRGSGGLLQKNYKLQVGAIDILLRPVYTSLHCYNGNDFQLNYSDLLLELCSELRLYFESEPFERGGDQMKISATDTLITKIVLGTLACTPAYDEFLKSGLGLCSTIPSKFGKKGMISLFNWAVKFEIESLRSKLPITSNEFPKMKLLDIYFWSLGRALWLIEK